MNIICPKCGTPFDDRYRICPVCGTDIAAYTNLNSANPSSPEQSAAPNKQPPAYNNNVNGQSQQPYFDNQGQPQQPYFDNQNQSQQPYFDNQNQPQQPYFDNQNQPQQPYFDNQGQPQQPYFDNQNQPQQPYFDNQNQSQQPYFNNQGQPQQPYFDNQNQSQQPYYDNQGQPQQPYKMPKAKKKHKLPWILRFIIANLIIALVLLGAWFAFGNIITLNIHGDEVVETLNSGSLNLPGMNNAYSELPNYVKDMLGDEIDYSGEYGPMTKAILPYVSAEKVKVNGFFGGSSIEYKITAPDIESWLLGLEPSNITSADALLAMMEEYMQYAPMRSVIVTVEYSRNGFFSVDWYGNYYTREFSDAICGGFNSAYNELYQKVYKELIENVYGTQEVQQ